MKNQWVMDDFDGALTHVRLIYTLTGRQILRCKGVSLGF